MDERFYFEIGVFSAGFIPTLENQADWVANWHPVDRSSYQSASNRFDQVKTLTSNTAPFTPGTPGWVWGFRGGTSSSEWILFRSSDWNWPNVSPSGPPGFPLDWNAADANVILTGALNPSGAPFLMRSAAVSLPSPPTTWKQWQDSELADEPRNAPDDDPDGDGVSNLLEYVFGSPPKRSGSSPGISRAVVGGFLELTIPRRRDHPSALLEVEVSSDLKNWYSGLGQTVEISNGPAAWVVRDALPCEGEAKRFMRVKVILP